jgi:hypothetical protein
MDPSRPRTPTCLSGAEAGVRSLGRFAWGSGQGGGPGVGEMGERRVGRSRRVRLSRKAHLEGQEGGRRHTGLHPLACRLLDADEVIVPRTMRAGVVSTLDSGSPVLRHHVEEGHRNTHHGQEGCQEEPHETLRLWIPSVHPLALTSIVQEPTLTYHLRNPVTFVNERLRSRPARDTPQPGPIPWVGHPFGDPRAICPGVFRGSGSDGVRARDPCRPAFARAPCLPSIHEPEEGSRLWHPSRRYSAPGGVCSWPCWGWP